MTAWQKHERAAAEAEAVRQLLPDAVPVCHVDPQSFRGHVLSTLRPKERAIVEKRLAERPAHVDPQPTIAPGMLRRCVMGKESVYGPFPASCYIDDDCGACDEPTCKWSQRNIARRSGG